jgi:hypothetical protein
VIEFPTNSAVESCPAAANFCAAVFTVSSFEVRQNDGRAYLSLRRR